MRITLLAITLVTSILLCDSTHAQFGEAQLANLLKRFPEADANGDGKLSRAEAQAYRQHLQSPRGKGGVSKSFSVDPGWEEDRFPAHAVCYMEPDAIAALYARSAGQRRAIIKYDEPSDGSLRIVGTGHSFMAPGYQTLPVIAEAAGLKQPPLLTHTGGGMTGSARYKWEQENGIFQFDGKPTPKLLASIANSEWDAMMWGPYYNDQPEYYACWIDFCLQYNPDMKFYVSDAWPQLEQLGKVPKSEAALTPEVFKQLGIQKHEMYSSLIDELNEKYDDRVFVMPTSDAMVLCVEYYHAGKLPGIEGIHKVVGKKERSLWRDQLGHLGPGLGNLEGYVFYATLYGRSPELIQGEIFNDGNFPSRQLDQQFREIAWKAVTGNPMSGIVDENQNGIADDRE